MQVPLLFLFFRVSALKLGRFANLRLSGFIGGKKAFLCYIAHL
jgi:hypothetical protein